MSTLYSTQKALHHPDRLVAIREGRTPAPVHLHFILSDLCNQDCVPAGTMIDCPGGRRPIESLAVGDQVIGPDGQPVQITRYGSRYAEELFEIKAGGHTIRCTGEHPLLTADGWKEARHIRAGRDSTAVRVRMRAAPEVESPVEALGQVHIRALADKAGQQQVPGVEGHEASQGGRRPGAPLPVWLWRAGHAAQAWCRTLLERLRAWASDARAHRHSQPRRPARDVKTHARSQSHEGREGRAEGRALTGSGRVAHEDRAQVLTILQDGEPADLLPWERQALDRAPEPGLPSRWTAEGHRDHDVRDLQRWQGGEAHAQDVREAAGVALLDPRVGVPGGVLSPGSSAEAPELSAHSAPRLLLEGIELERGLELRSVDAVCLIAGRVVVYNFACPPIESYVADGFTAHNCSFCAYRMSSGLSSELFKTAETHNPNRKIPTEKALEIVGDAAALGVKAIQFTGGGEPTVHPDHLRIMAAAQAQGIETALVTNGVKLDPNHPAMHAHEWIRVSVDAGNAEMYRQVRRVPDGHWSRVWANVAMLAAHPDWKGTLGIGYVITPENYEGLLECGQLAKASGASNVRVGAVFSSDGLSYYPDGLVNVIADRVAEAKSQLDGDGFEMIDLFGRRIGDLEAGHPDFERCGYQYTTWYVGGDLNLYRCCNVAYTRNGLVTSLKDKRLADVIEGRLHEPFDARSCIHCQFLGANHAIHSGDQATGPAPQHANFV